MIAAIQIPNLGFADVSERKWETRDEPHVTDLPSPLLEVLQLPFGLSPAFHALRPRPWFSERHGFFTAECRRAGSDDEDFGEEAG